ncbi:hypothetical protein DFQ28_005237 [Apophysomyces sp. BC1034]|nr:hypothetical protein DFQ30_007947 [Apophysomyces sp. BC1015]KAG0176603.1 hypothetical protein DFQ29_005932 [Apophysomyces sp. BC1021]KAG0188201.1 hypothetical protein DFQ28_005237 [Apophysomyces sp. BC1034]
MALVSLETAEKIVNLVGLRKKFSDDGQIVQILSAIQDAVTERRYSIRHFCLTVEALKCQYNRKIHNARGQINSLEKQVNDLERKVDRLGQREVRLEKAKGKCHNHLRMLRLVAEWRRKKKQKRDSQYAVFSFVPLLSSYYKKKFIRARDKNAQIEQKLSEAQYALSTFHPALRRLIDTRRRYIVDINQAKCEKDELTVTLASLEKLLDFVILGQQFWTNFDDHQTCYVLQDSVQLMKMFQAKQTEGDDWNNLILSFKLACLEYSEKEEQGNELWGSIQVEFECAHCNATCHAWPWTDRACSTDLLCNQCFQQSQPKKSKVVQHSSTRFFNQFVKWKRSMIHCTKGQ